MCRITLVNDVFSYAIFICLERERRIFLRDIIDILSSGLIASGTGEEKGRRGEEKVIISR